MAYSLFLGSGPAGQLEIFSALFKTALDKGTEFTKAVETSYEQVLQVAKSVNGRGISPFPGMAISSQDPNKDFIKYNFDVFHPIKLYTLYAELASTNLSLPILAIDGSEKYINCLAQVVQEDNLGSQIIPKAMKNLFEETHNASHYPGVSDNLPEVSGIIKSEGYPTLLSGAHFLTIAPNQHAENHGPIALISRIPDNITSLMGDDTQMIFLEEGDLVYDQGHNYASALGNPDGEESNGLLDFEKYAARFLNLNDSQKRDFKVDIYPKKFLTEYDRRKIDYGQVLVKVAVNNIQKSCKSLDRPNGDSLWL